LLSCCRRRHCCFIFGFWPKIKQEQPTVLKQQQTNNKTVAFLINCYVLAPTVILGSFFVLLAASLPTIQKSCQQK
jgi:hypothetical protein